MMEYYLAIKKTEVLLFVTDDPWGYYAKYSKSDGVRQIPYDFTYLRNIEKKDETNRNKLIDTV